MKDLLLQVVKVLALSTDDLLRYLPASSLDITYQLPGEGGDVTSPAEAIVRAAFKVIDEAIPAQASDSRRELLADVVTFLIMMLDLSERAHPGMFRLDKGWLQARSRLDEAWSVLRRLANLALSALSAETGGPEIPFLDVIGRAGIRRVRLERVPL